MKKSRKKSLLIIILSLRRQNGKCHVNKFYINTSNPLQLSRDGPFFLFLEKKRRKKREREKKVTDYKIMLQPFNTRSFQILHSSLLVFSSLPERRSYLKNIESTLSDFSIITILISALVFPVDFGQNCREKVETAVYHAKRWKLFNCSEDMYNV